MPASAGAATAHGLAAKPSAASGPGPAKTWVLPQPPPTGEGEAVATEGRAEVVVGDGLGAVLVGDGDSVFEHAAISRPTDTVIAIVRPRMTALLARWFWHPALSP